MSGLIGRKPDGSNGVKVEPPAPAGGILGKYPGLVEYMHVSKWEDGKPRQPATMSVFVEEGRVKLALNDRALSRSGYAAGDTLEACLKALEGHLQAGDMEWRGWKGRK